ncbi:MAG: hypothetical protein ABIG71_01610 [Candidatus Uhrbacteria bacterium]
MGQTQDVYCHIAEEVITPTMCADEQDDTMCVGCAAATRRCTACGKTTEITDTHEGLCALCVTVLGRVLKRRQAPPPSMDAALDEILGTLRALSTRSVDDGATHTPSAAPPPPAVLRQPRALLSILAEHAQKRGDTTIVQSPIMVLRSRAKLTIDEASQVLQKLEELGELTWSIEAAQLLREEPRAASDEMQAQIAPAARKRHSISATQEKAKRPERSERQKRSAPPTSPPTSQTRSGTAQMKTYADVYSMLSERAGSSNDERIVRGAVPMLQLALRIGPRDIVQILEELKQLGHIEQRDGWRTIVLLAEHVDDDRHAIMAPLTAQHAPTASRRATKQLELRVLPGNGEQPKRARPQPIRRVPSTTQDEELPTLPMVDAAIDELGQRLPELRALRDDIAQRVATLEASLAALRSTRDQFEEVDAQTKRALHEAEGVAEQLLATLRSSK